MHKERSHVLESPVLVRPTEGPGLGVLPIGTRLYFDRTTPEGSDLFHVFVRVEGAEFALAPLEKQGLVDPLGIEAITPGRPAESARKADLTELRTILDAFGVEKRDLEQLLGQYDTPTDH